LDLGAPDLGKLRCADGGTLEIRTKILYRRYRWDVAKYFRLLDLLRELRGWYFQSPAIL